MLKACKYCGNIHDSRYVCGKKPTYKAKANDSKSRFRRTNVWTEKSKQIRERDTYLCQICKRMIAMTGDMKQYNSAELQVHHIISLEEDFGLRLEDNNLLTVCAYHHEMCEDGRISRDTQLKIAYEQETT